MARLTEAEKAARARERMMETATGKGPTAYKTDIVAPLFQRMIRAEYGADPRPYVTAVVGGELRQVRRKIGQVVCVTCGDVYPWTHPEKLINTGHFLGRGNSIIFEETNVAPQCVGCNEWGGGERHLYKLWVAFMYGAEEVERLQRLKNETRKFTIGELVDMLIQFRERLKAAKKAMGEHA